MQLLSSRPAKLALLAGLLLPTLGSAEPLNTERRVSGIITAVESGAITICALDGKHTTTGRVDASKTRVTINGKGARPGDLKVTFPARGAIGLDDVWLSVAAESK
jgi:hypothetical protein